MYLPPHLRVVEFPRKGYGVLAVRSIGKGELVCELFFDSVKPRACAVNSVQAGKDAFLSNSLKTIDDLFNHSCSPNLRVDISRAEFRSLRNISAGEEVTWNYLTTEYDLVRSRQDFDCFCCAQNCIGRIRGFTYLSASQKRALVPHLSPFLRTM